MENGGALQNGGGEDNAGEAQDNVEGALAEDEDPDTNASDEDGGAQGGGDHHDPDTDRVSDTPSAETLETPRPAGKRLRKKKQASRSKLISVVIDFPKHHTMHAMPISLTFEYTGLAANFIHSDMLV